MRFDLGLKVIIGALTKRHLLSPVSILPKNIPFRVECQQEIEDAIGFQQSAFSLIWCALRAVV